MKQALLLSSVLLASGLFAAGQEKKVRFEDLPPSVQKSAQEQSQGATVRGYSQEKENGKIYYEVEPRAAGKNKDVLLVGKRRGSLDRSADGPCRGALLRYGRLKKRSG